MFENVSVNSKRWFEVNDLKNECWKDIDESYMVSNYGRVKSKERIYYHWNGFCYCNLPIKEKILKCSISKQGYYRVSIGFKNKRKPIKIHQLVAKCFLENPNNYNCINHIDGNKLNNKINNLEYCTSQHNVQEAYRLGLMKKPITGKGNPRNKKVAKMNLTTGEIIEIYYSLKQAEKENNISYQNISSCCRGLTKYAGKYKWKYL